MPFWRRRAVEPLPEDWEDIVAGRVRNWWDLPLEVRTGIGDVAEHLIATKRWEAAAGFALTDEVRLVIASQAALPVLGLEPAVRSYGNVRSIIVHAEAIAAGGEREGPVEGTYIDDDDWSSGEAGHDDDPIVLAWSDVLWDLRHPRAGRNVVVHEFAHKLDMLDGTVDGMPPLPPGLPADRWIAVCEDAFDELDAGGSPVLDDYGAEDPGEFFSVTSEVFFTRPAALAQHHPDLYAVFAEAYRQDPRTWSTP
jgi:Mlc titration factor MtfA (ptsG expression regulator)